MTQVSRREFMARTSMGAAGFALLGGATLRADPLGIPIGSQTYPVRARIAQGEFVAVLKEMYEAGIRQIELCSPRGYADFKSLSDGKQTKTIIEDNGLKCVSCHFSYAEFRDSLPQTLEWAHAVGLTQMGTASLPQNMGTQASPIVVMSGGVTSEESIKRAADVYGKIGAATKAAGIQLFLHNEGFENSRTNDGRLTYPILLSALDPDLVKMQFQMSSMRTIGDPVMYFTMYPGRFESVHLQGVDATAGVNAPGPGRLTVKAPPQPAGGGRGAAPAGGQGGGNQGLAVGEDSVDWVKVFEAGKIGGLKHFFVEQSWDLTVKSVAFLKNLTVK